MNAGRDDCHYLLGRLLDSISFQPQRDWVLTYLSSGAPQLITTQPGDLSISMSRTGPWLSAGVSLGAEIGIDIETIRPRSQLHEKASFLNWRMPITDLLDFYANWTLWEAGAKCVNGNVFMQNNLAYEQLCQIKTDNKLAHIGDWYGWRQQLGREVYCALVLHSSINNKLGFRTLRLDNARPWPVQQSKFARPKVNLLNQCA